MVEWKTTRVSEFLKEREGRYKPTDPAVLDLKRLNKIDFTGEIHLSDKNSKTNMIIVEPGDLVISGINVSKGAIAVYHGEEPVAATIHYSSYEFDEEKIEIEYFKRFVKSQSFVQSLKEQVKGGIKTEIKPKHFLPLKICLPDIDSQKEIVSFFNRVEDDMAELSNEIECQQGYFKKFRQQILQEAIEGKLTAEWRVNNPKLISGDNHALKLLEKIKAEKEKLFKEKKIKKQKPLAPIIDDEKPFDLPDGWVWCRLGNLSLKIGSGSTPRGSNYSTKGIPFFRSQNIHDRGLVYNDIKFISDDIHRKMKGTVVQCDDVLLNITGGSLGRCALVPSDFSEGNVSQHVCIIRGIKINHKYLHIVMLSSLSQRMIFNNTTGAGREGLPKYNLEQFVITVPPLPEQQAIVERVDALKGIIDELEKQVTERKEQSQMLMQSVLKEAFES